MNPAEIFVWAVVVVSGAWLVATSVIPIALRGLVALGGLVRPLSRPIATIVAAILLIGVMRSSPGSATVPPPSERVVVDSGPGTSAIAATNPFRVTGTAASVGSTYTVTTGDTLWGIARHILGRSGSTPTGAQISEAWKMIYATNADVVGVNPDLILPGQVLTIPGGIHG